MFSRFTPSRPARARRGFTLALGLVAAGFAAMVAPTDAEAQRARARVSGDVLVTSDGGRLRGAPVFFDNWNHTDFDQKRSTYRQEFERVTRDFGLNVVRICPYMGSYEINLKTNNSLREDYMDWILTYVKWARDNNVYAIINCHNQTQGWNKQAVLDFWEVVMDPNQNADGMNFANQSHVMFELTNEPLVNESKGDWQAIYDFVRGKAPNSIIIVGSLIGPDQNGYSPNDLNALNVDWSKTVYGFHCYQGAFDPVGSPLDDRVWTIQAPKFTNYSSSKNPNGFPVLCTELVSLTNANDLPINYDILGKTIRQAEDAGIGWITWAPRMQYQAIGNPTDSFNIYHNDIDFDGNFINAMNANGLSVATFRNESGNGSGSSSGGSNNVGYPINWNADQATIPVGCKVYQGFGVASFDAWQNNTNEPNRFDQFRVGYRDYGSNGFNDIAFRYATASPFMKVRVWAQYDSSGGNKWDFLGTIHCPGTGGWDNYSWSGIKLNRYITGNRRIIFRAAENGGNVQRLQFKRS